MNPTDNSGNFDTLILKSPSQSPEQTPVQTPINSPFQSPYKSPGIYGNVIPNATNLTSEFQNKIYNRLADSFKPYPINYNFFNMLSNEINVQSGKPGIFFGAAVDKPEFYVFENDVVLRVRNVLSKGAQSEVVIGDLINLKRDTPVKSRVVKVTRNRVGFKTTSDFSPESKLMARIKNENPDSLQYLDAIHSKGKVQKNGKSHFYGIYTTAKMDFNGLEYSPQAPVSQFLPFLITAAKGLEVLHTIGKVVHCDVKGDNILIADKEAKITDFGCLREQSGDTDLHGTNVTPFFAAPQTWKNWRKQSIGEGKQEDPKLDVFSYGRVLQYEVILKVLDQTLENIRENHPEFEKLSSQYQELKKALLPIEKLYHFIEDAAILTKIDRDCTGRFIVPASLKLKSKTLLFPTSESLLKLTNQAIDLFAEILPCCELKILRGLAELATKMQDKELSAIPTMAQVGKSLEDLSVEPVINSFPTKNTNSGKKIKAETELPGQPLLKKTTYDQITRKLF